MKKINENMDTETALYYILAKAKDNEIYDSIGRFTTKVMNLYMKRFGLKDYATSIPEEEFSEQLVDCIEHLAITDEDGKKIFNVFTDQVEQCFIGAMISNIMIGEAV